MSDDPETARQIAELSHDTRPLLVLDVDEVVLDFVDPFSRFLNSQGFELLTDSFRIHGNIVGLENREALQSDAVSALMTGFFDVHDAWQTAASDAVATLDSLSAGAEIVLLTAMPHRHRTVRRGLLDRLSLPYPLVSTEAAKGPAVRSIRGRTSRPVAFIDDMPRNLESVAARGARRGTVPYDEPRGVSGLSAAAAGRHHRTRKLDGRRAQDRSRTRDFSEFVAHQRPARLALHEPARTRLSRTPASSRRTARSNAELLRQVDRTGLDQRAPFWRANSMPPRRPAGA